MISRRPAKRAAVVTAVTLVPLAVFGGVGLAKGNPSASEYQYGPSGGQYGKVAVCHKTGSKKHPWHRINVALPAWNHAHSHHGDFQIDATHPCPPVTAFKWALGHLIAAAGILETTLALVALRRQTVPGIATLDSLAPECAGLPLSNAAQRPRNDIALIVCRGFAGTDAALVVRAAAA